MIAMEKASGNVPFAGIGELLGRGSSLAVFIIHRQ